MFFKKDDSVGFNEEVIINKENETPNEGLNNDVLESSPNVEVIEQEVPKEEAAFEEELTKLTEQAKEKSWLEQLEEKVLSLKILEEERTTKQSEQTEMQVEINKIKEQLAELQLNFEKHNDELEEIELKWAVGKDELAELAMK